MSLVDSSVHLRSATAPETQTRDGHPNENIHNENDSSPLYAGDLYTEKTPRKSLTPR